MVRVRLLEPLAGVTEYYPAGTELELRAHVAIRYIQNKIAEPVFPAGQAAYDQKLWTFRIDPQAYLRRHPDGPNAELARKVLAAC